MSKTDIRLTYLHDDDDEEEEGEEEEEEANERSTYKEEHVRRRRTYQTYREEAQTFGGYANGKLNE